MISSRESLVFFADLLGFGGLAARPGAEKARDTLSYLAHLFSGSDELTALVQSPVWEGRYGLSDSIFLVTEDVAGGCRAASELFFALAYVQVDEQAPVFLRGALTRGEAYRVEPLFPESATANLVGHGVVEAVRLEATLKGPRLQVAEQLAGEMRTLFVELPAFRKAQSGVWEILWPLGPSVRSVNPTMVGEICGLAARVFLETAGSGSLRPHYRPFLELGLSSIEWLAEREPESAGLAIESSRLAEYRDFLLKHMEPDSSRRLLRLLTA